MLPRRQSWFQEFFGCAEEGALHQRTHSSPTRLGIFLAFTIAALPLFAQQPDETLPGFRSNTVLDGYGSDSVDLFSGNVALVIPIGPEYTLGPTFQFRLNAYYSAKLWHLDRSPCISPGQFDYHAILSGYPALGAGWNIDLGYWLPKSDGSGGTYHSRDGASHWVPFATGTYSGYTTDGTRLRATQSGSCTNGCTATVEFPNGIVESFNQFYAPPGPLSASSMDFTDENASQTVPRANRLGLSTIKDSFGTTLLTVTYDATDTWRVARVTLSALSGAPSISYNWKDLTNSSGNPAWRVLDSIVFPSPQGKSRRVTFVTSARAIARNGYDSVNRGGALCFPSVPSAAWAPVLSEIDYADNAAPSTTLLKYTFAYDSSGTPLTDGLLTSYRPPAGGTISYTYSVADVIYVDSIGFGAIEDKGFERTPTPLAAVSASCPASNGFLDGDFAADSPVAVTRAVTGVSVPMTTQYDRAIYQEEDIVGGCPVYDDKHITKVVNVTYQDGNGGERTTKHLFHYAFVSQFQDSSGMELEERAYSNNNVTTTGSLARTRVFCHESDNSTSPACGVLTGSGAGVDYHGFGHNIREQAAVTWYGSNPEGGGSCPNGSVACTESARSGYTYPGSVSVADAGHYSTDTVTSDLPSVPTGWNRQTTTTWAPQTGTRWLPDLFSKKIAAESGAAAPNTASIGYTFDSTGFLTNRCASDATYGVISSTFVKGAGGNPTSDSIAKGTGTSCSGLAAQFTKNWTWANGLPLTDKWSGMAWNSFNVVRDSTGTVTTSKDPNNLATSYSYDALGRMTKISPPGGDATTYFCYDSATQTTSYQSTANPATPCPYTTQSALSWNRSIYDGVGRLLREIHSMPAGYAVRIHKYDAAGHESFVSEWSPCGTTSACASATPANGTTMSSFDPFDRPRTVTKADGSMISISYADGSITHSDSRESVTVNNVSGAASTTVTRKDALGRVISVTEPAVGGIADQTTYTYNALDKLATVSQGSQSRSFAYDSFGFLRSETNPEKGTSGNGTTSYTSYDALGNLLSKTDGGNTYTFTYDAAGRLLTEKQGATLFAENCYDGSAAVATCPDGTTANSSGGTGHLGRLSRRIGFNPGLTNPSNPSVTEDFLYSDPSGRLQTKTIALTRTPAGTITATETWAYTALGQVASFGHPQTNGSPTTFSATTYAAGLPTLLTTASGTQTLAGNVTYAASGALSGWKAGPSAGTGLVTTISSDTSGIPRPSQIKSVSGTTTVFDTGAYSYDGAGNITKMGTMTFSYDARSRLTADTAFGSHGYSYDRYGNLTSAGAASTSTNRLTGGTYDALGNLTSFGGKTYAYDAFSRQTSYASGSTSEQYVYDAAGERIARIAGGIWYTTFRDEGNRLSTEYTISTGLPTRTKDYFYLGNLLVSTYNQSTYSFYTSDHLGTPRYVSNSSGGLVEKHDYLPYGQEVAGSFGVEPLKFALMERDQTSTNDYDHARFHLTGMGRFAGVDLLRGVTVLPQSWNRYSYVLGNPMKFVDPAGLWRLGASVESIEEESPGSGGFRCPQDDQNCVDVDRNYYDPNRGIAGLWDLTVGSSTLASAVAGDGGGGRASRSSKPCDGPVARGLAKVPPFSVGLDAPFPPANPVINSGFSFNLGFDSRTMSASVYIGYGIVVLADGRVGSSADVISTGPSPKAGGRFRGGVNFSGAAPVSGRSLLLPTNLGASGSYFFPVYPAGLPEGSSGPALVAGAGGSFTVGVNWVGSLGCNN
jgi:RHS repeat-associated protein